MFKYIVARNIKANRRHWQNEMRSASDGAWKGKHNWKCNNTTTGRDGKVSCMPSCCLMILKIIKLDWSAKW
jgi:hypothetical protein